MNVKVDNETLVFEEEANNITVFEAIVKRHMFEAVDKNEIAYWCSLYRMIETQGVEFALETYLEDLKMSGGMLEWN